MKEAYARSKVIVALDLPPAQALTMMSNLRGVVGWVKIGLELFIRGGSTIVADARDMGYDVFLDLKLKDIPNTVERAIHSIGSLGVSMTNIHLDGTAAMVQAAVLAAKNYPTMTLLGVTVLTSMTEESLGEIGINGSVEAQVLRLAKIGVNWGIHGVVCSPQEVLALRTLYPGGFKIITPGVRSVGEKSHDQARISTPETAIQRGADFVVCGREITTASDPRAAAEKIVDNIAATN